MNVYKVVEAFKNRLYSTHAPGLFSREYIVGLPTTPHPDFPEAYLMAFDSFESVGKFCSHSDRKILSWKLFIAEAKVMWPAKEVAARWTDERDIRQFWTDWYTTVMLNSAPEGTLMCESITLIEEIT